MRTARFPPAVLQVLEALDVAGHRSWLVGGAVRDVLLGRARAAADLDVATPARPAEVMELFARTIPTGVEHGTVTVLAGGEPVEVTTFRGEGAYLDGRRPSHVMFLDDVDGDLARRDFTVNAMAWDPIGREFRDPFGGCADLDRGVLRAVGDPAERFGEDGLRPLRAARFAAQLGFEVERRTAAAIPDALPTVRRVAAERVTDELSRLLVAPHARRGLELMRRTGLLDVVLPELAGLPPRAVTHAFDLTVGSEPDLAVRLAALLHGPSAGATGSARRGHLDSGTSGPHARCDRIGGDLLGTLRFSRNVRDRALALVAEHRCLLTRRVPPLPADDAETRRWLARVPDREALLALARAEVRSLGGTASARRHRAELASFTRRVKRVVARRPPLGVSDLALDGRAVMAILGVSGGPLVGAALRHLVERVLTEPALNTRERLTSVLEEWAARAGDSTPPRPGQGLRPPRHGPGEAR